MERVTRSHFRKRALNVALGVTMVCRGLPCSPVGIRLDQLGTRAGVACRGSRCLLGLVDCLAWAVVVCQRRG